MEPYAAFYVGDGGGGIQMPQQAARSTVEQLRVLIQAARDVLTQSRETITRVDATKPPKPPEPPPR
jgi:hypothetical protein